jgi:VWFA-related protein
MTLSRLHTFCVAAVFTCLLPAAPAQAPSDQPVVLHSSTRLVQISVVVHDRKGQPVPDLKKEEFSLIEKGTPQNISVFSVDSTARRPTVAPTLPPHNFTNRIEDRPDIPSSVTVILLDSLTTKVEDQMYARARLVTFLQQLQPEDRVAIYSLGRSLRVLHDFTTDSSALLARLAKYRGPNLDIAWSESGEMVDAEMFGTSHVGADFYLTERAVNTLKALEAVAEHLAGLPGART